MERLTTTITTDGDGAATAYVEPTQPGYIRGIRYVKAGSENYSDGVQAVITGERSGIEILTWAAMNATGTKCPQMATHSIVAAAENYNDEGDEAVNAPIPFAGERIKIVLSSGGATKTGTFHIWIG